MNQKSGSGFNSNVSTLFFERLYQNNVCFFFLDFSIGGNR